MTAARQPIRLVLLVEDLDFGGTQRYASYLARHLDRERFETAIWTLRGGNDFRPTVEAAGVPIVDLTRAKKVGPKAIARLALQLLADRPEVIYTLTVLPNIWGRAFAGLLGVPVVSGYRNYMPAQHEWLLARFSRKIVANAERLRGVLTDRLGVAADKVEVVANGVDIGHFQPRAGAAPQPPLILCVARRVGRKDLPTLLAAFRIVRERRPDVRLRIVGNGPVDLAGGAGVEVLPAPGDIRPQLAEATVFALSSVDEGAPNVILEAMAAGLPVVTTEAGGAGELVVPGVTGLTVGQGDAAALAEALLAVIGDPERAAAMGAAGRARVETDFSLAAMVAASGRILAEAAGRRE